MASGRCGQQLHPAEGAASSFIQRRARPWWPSASTSGKRDRGGRQLQPAESVADDIVFRDILLSEKTEDGIFAVPLDFYISTLYARQGEPLLEDRQMTWREFFDEISGLDLAKDHVYAGLELDVFMARFISRVSDFIDEAGNTEDLYSADMISILEECRDWRDMGLCADIRDTGSYLASSWAYVESPAGHYHSLAYALCTLPEDYSRISEGYYPGCRFAPMLYDGDPVITGGIERYPQKNEGMGRYGVNAGSPRAEAAQDFLRFLLSAEGQEKMVCTEQYYAESQHFNGFYIPLNRAEFRGMVGRDLDRIQESLKERIPPSDSVLVIDELVNEAEGAVDRIAYIITERPYYRTIIREAAKQFFLDEISAEDAARQMSDKVGLYLKEQG